MEGELNNENNGEIQTKPEATSSRIIIESNDQSYNFDKKSYCPEFLQGIITKSEWDIIIVEASKIMGQSWGKKKTFDLIKLPKFMVVLAILSVLLTIVYMITLYIAATSDGDTTVLLTISIIAISLGTVLAGVLATYNFTRKIGKFQTLDEIMQQDIDEYLVAQNSNYKNKLEFVYYTGPKWIEVNILDKRNVNNVLVTDERKNLMTNELNTEPVVEKNKEENGGRQSSGNSNRHSRNQSAI